MDELPTCRLFPRAWRSFTTDVHGLTTDLRKFTTDAQGFTTDSWTFTTDAHKNSDFKRNSMQNHQHSK